MEEKKKTADKISVEKVQDILLSLPIKQKIEEISLRYALGRVLAEEVAACEMVPAFDRSPYDGYAFRGEDTLSATKETPAVLAITEEIPAGKQPEHEVTSGKAAKILTGAPIPKGANATIKYEDTVFTADKVEIFSPVLPDTDIVRAGEDISTGEVIALKGSVVTPPLMGVLAGQGKALLKVYAKPRVMIINAGSELVEVDDELLPAKIRNSNFYTLSGYLANFGIDVIYGGIVEDELDAVADKILSSFNEADVVITTGGASVGDYDWAVRSAEKLGAEILFHKIAMKPGGSMMAAKCGDKMIFGLSGSPAAATIDLLYIVLPYLKKISGRSEIHLETIEVKLKKALPKKSEQLRLLRGRLEFSETTAYFAENEGQGNGVVSSFVGCDLLGVIPAGSPPLPAGSKISAYRIQVTT